MKKYIYLIILFLLSFFLYSNAPSNLLIKHKYIETKYKNLVKNDLFKFFKTENNNDYNLDSIEFVFIPQARIYELDSILLTYDIKFYDLDTNLNNLEIGLISKNKIIGWISYKNYCDQFENKDYKPEIELNKKIDRSIFKSAIYQFFIANNINDNLKDRILFYDYFLGYMTLFEITDSCVYLDKGLNEKKEKFKYLFQITEEDKISTLIHKQYYFIYNNYFSKMIYNEETNQTNNQNKHLNNVSDFEKIYNNKIDSIKNYNLKYLKEKWDTLIHEKEKIYLEQIQKGHSKKENTSYLSLLRTYKKEMLDSIEMIVLPECSISFSKYNFKNTLLENLSNNFNVSKYLILAKYNGKAVFNMSQENEKNVINKFYLINGNMIEYNINTDFNIEIFDREYSFYLGNFYLFKEKNQYKISWRNSFTLNDSNRIQVNYNLENFVDKYFNYLFILHY